MRRDIFQSVQFRSKYDLFSVKRADTPRSLPILPRYGNTIVFETLGAFREPISTPALIRRQIIRQCWNTCRVFDVRGVSGSTTSKSELVIRVTVCVARGVARGIVDLSRVLSRGSRSPRLAVQPRHDPLRRLGFRPFCRVCNIKGRLKNDDASPLPLLPTLDTGVAIFSPSLTKIKMVEFHPWVYPVGRKRKAKKGNFDKNSSMNCKL